MKKGDIVLVDLNPTRGSEISKIRPCVVMTPNEIVDLMEVIHVIPLTSTKWDVPFRVPINRVGRGVSYAAIDQMRTVSKTRVRTLEESVTDDELTSLSDSIVEFFS
jgi:mRNA interferase MazF